MKKKDLEERVEALEAKIDNMPLKASDEDIERALGGAFMRYGRKIRNMIEGYSSQAVEIQMAKIEGYVDGALQEMEEHLEQMIKSKAKGGK